MGSYIDTYMRIQTEYRSFENCWRVSSSYYIQAHQHHSQWRCCFLQTALLWFSVLPDLSPVLSGLSPKLPSLSPALAGVVRCTQSSLQCFKVFPNTLQSLSWYSCTVLAMVPYLEPAGFIPLHGNGHTTSNIHDYLSESPNYAPKYLSDNSELGMWNMQCFMAHLLVVCNYWYFQNSATGGTKSSFSHYNWLSFQSYLLSFNNIEHWRPPKDDSMLHVLHTKLQIL